MQLEQQSIYIYKKKSASKELTEKLDSLDPQTSAEAAHTYVQESKQLHNSLNTWPSKTLERDTEKNIISRKKK